MTLNSQISARLCLPECRNQRCVPPLPRQVAVFFRGGHLQVLILHGPLPAKRVWRGTCHPYLFPGAPSASAHFQVSFSHLSFLLQEPPGLSIPKSSASFEFHNTLCAPSGPPSPSLLSLRLHQGLDLCCSFLSCKGPDKDHTGEDSQTPIPTLSHSWHALPPCYPITPSKLSHFLLECLLPGPPSIPRCSPLPS